MTFSCRQNNFKYILQIINMLILIMLVFFICWAPILIFNLLAAFSLLGPDNMGTGDTTKHLKTVFSLMAYLNRCYFSIILFYSLFLFSCLNPIIYGFMSKNFRESFISSSCTCRGNKKREQLL